MADRRYDRDVHQRNRSRHSISFHRQYDPWYHHLYVCETQETGISVAPYVIIHHDRKWDWFHVFHMYILVTNIEHAPVLVKDDHFNHFIRRIDVVGRISSE